MQDVIAARVSEATEALARVDDRVQRALADVAARLISCLRAGHTVFVCGNGGSAADAQHIAAELAGKFLHVRRALDCVALTINSSVLTAVGNDIAFEELFARQVEAHVRSGDVLWVLSTSGRSPNILRAASAAQRQGASVVGFTGGDGGDLPGVCDACFVAPVSTVYGIQQLHQLGYHVVCELVEQAFLERAGR